MEAQVANNLKRALLLWGPGAALLLMLGAGIIYLIAGVLGWEGAGRILIALCAGPVVGFVLIGAIWLVVRARTSPPQN